MCCSILWNHQTRNAFSYNVSHYCFISLKIKMYYHLSVQQPKDKQCNFMETFLMYKTMLLHGNFVQLCIVLLLGKCPSFFHHFVLQMHFSIWSPCPQWTYIHCENKQVNAKCFWLVMKEQKMKLSGLFQRVDPCGNFNKFFCNIFKGRIF